MPTTIRLRHSQPCVQSGYPGQSQQASLTERRLLAEAYKLWPFLLASACAWMALTCTTNFEPQAAGTLTPPTATAAPTFVPPPSPGTGFPKSSTATPQPTVATRATATIVSTVTPIASSVEPTSTAQPQAIPENPAPPIPSPTPKPSAPPPVVGSNTGNRIPDFTLQLRNGTTITSNILLSENQPTFLYFFAAW